MSILEDNRTKKEDDGRTWSVRPSSFLSGKTKNPLFCETGCDMMMLPRNQIEPDTEDVFLPFGKNAPSILASFGFGSYDCVAANEALRFSCVVASLRLRTFYFPRKARGNYNKEREV